MLSLQFSNRQEVLLERLLERLGEAHPGPFGVREIIVPSTAMRRQVELAVAEREGVAINLHFSYLAQWLWAQIGKLVPVGEESPFSPPVLAWRLHALLGEHDWTARQPRLARYLEGASERMRFELAERCARLFDQYLTYRPHWLARWAEGGTIAGLDAEGRDDEAWQSELWRRLVRALGVGAEHPSHVFLRALETRGSAAAAGLPARVEVFCVPALPPLYLELLLRLGQWIDLRLYVLNPCREYWFEIVAPRRLSWLEARARAHGHETGNVLLAAWGRQTQAQIDLLYEASGDTVVDEACFVPASGNHLLARLQNAVLDLVDPAPGSVPLEAADRSLEVHVCHGLARELEVLHDRLLECFDQDEGLRPQDVFVLTPDLDRAAPLIEAVFGSAPAHRRIPWQITGLGQTRINPVARVLDAALTLAAGRHPVSALFELLRMAPVAQRFGFDREGLERVHGWLRVAGVHWGLGAEHRSRLGLPGGERHTLGDGLQRLFLAYAWGEDEAPAAIAGAGVPAGDPEGAAALDLGRLSRFAEQIERYSAECARSHDAEGWCELLSDLLDGLVPATSEWIDDLRLVRAAIEALRAQWRAADFAGALPLEVVHGVLTEALDEPARGGVPTGAVSFAALPSLRGLPAGMICAIGLDDGVFPGNAGSLEFDLMTRLSARGDRQRRTDDRNLFLDLLLAARSRLHLSYSGRSVRDNSEAPPSVLVDELLDYASRLCASDPARPEARQDVRRRLTVEHPLQAFSERYFDASEGDPRLTSYREDTCEALRQREAARGLPSAGMPAEDAGTIAERAMSPNDDADDEDDRPDTAELRAAPPFLAASLAPAGEQWRQPTVEHLVRFLRQPAAYLLRQRLGIALPGADEELDDDEAFVPAYDAPERLARRILPALLAGAGAPRVRELAAAGGEYPDGALGAARLDTELVRLAAFAGPLRAALAEGPLPARTQRLPFVLDGEDWALQVAFSDLRSGGLVRYRYRDARAADLLEAWIAHLALCAMAPPGVALRSEWHARDRIFHLRPCEPAHERLAELMALYRQGLREPVPFFARSGWAWISKGSRMADALRAWRGHWRSDGAQRGERDVPAVRLAWRGRVDPLERAFERFEALAATVFEPLLQHLDDEDGVVTEPGGEA